MHEKRSGFTLVELIVASVCGSLLLGLSLPMIQRGDEEANRLACLDNLRNIGMASLDYNDVNNRLPPFMGVPGNQSSVTAVFAIALNYQLTYSLTQLLDFTGHSDLVGLTDPFAFSSKDATIQDAGYSSFSSAWLPGIDAKMPGIGNIALDIQIPGFRCPSDPNAPTDTVYIGPHPTNNAQMGVFLEQSSSAPYSITNYAGNIGGFAVTTTPSFPTLIGFHGPMRSRQSDSVDGIVDGASNVVLFGESLGAINAAFNRRYSLVMGGLAVGRGDSYGATDVFGTATDAHWIQFGSAHPEVVNIVRADGSAQSVNRAVQPTTFGRFCGVADGRPFFDIAID